MKIVLSAVLAALSIAGVVGLPGSACAADLFRHHHARRHISSYALHAYPEDAACQTFEPTEYEPRTVNFHEPLCYAARPYGISQHLYDYSTLLRPTHASGGIY